MEKEEPQTEYLSVKEACDLLKVSSRTLERWRQVGMPYIQVTKRGRVLFDKEEILSWLKYFKYPFKERIEEIKNFKF